jgi:hypothetical protein
VNNECLFILDSDRSETLSAQLESLDLKASPDGVLARCVQQTPDFTQLDEADLRKALTAVTSSQDPLAKIYFDAFSSRTVPKRVEKCRDPLLR